MVLTHRQFDGTFTLTWPTFDAIPADWAVQLEDTQTGRTVDLRTESSYAFNASASEQAEGFEANARVASGTTRFVLRITPASTVAAEGAEASTTQLRAVYPNPVASSATVAYHLAQAGRVRLDVFDVLGRKVAVLAEGMREAGPQQATWQAQNAAAGVYLVRLTTEGRVFTRRIVRQ